MGLFDSLKSGLHSVTNKLGLDDKIAGALEEMIIKLEVLSEENKLDGTTQNAVAAFKAVLEKFRLKEETLETVLAKARELIAKLPETELPDSIKAIIGKVKGFLK